LPAALASNVHYFENLLLRYTYYLPARPGFVISNYMDKL